jgi:hypothetical protein
LGFPEQAKSGALLRFSPGLSENRKNIDRQGNRMVPEGYFISPALSVCFHYSISLCGKRPVFGKEGIDKRY